MRRNLLTTTGTTRTRSRAGGVIALVLAATLGLGACSTSQEGGADGASTTSAGPEAGNGATADGAEGTGGAEAAPLDTESLPDPVAEVNGAEITKADFVSAFDQQQTAAQQQAEMGGGPVDEQALADSVLETLVSSELFTQEGERLGIEPSAKEVDAKLDSLAEENGMGSRDELLSTLAEQGAKEDQVREEVSRILVIDEVLAERGGVEKPTEKELKAYYEELTGGAEGEAGAEATGGADIPAYEDVKGQLETQLTQEKENEKLSSILEDLEKDAKITRHL